MTIENGPFRFEPGFGASTSSDDAPGVARATEPVAAAAHDGAGGAILGLGGAPEDAGRIRAADRESTERAADARDGQGLFAMSLGGAVALVAADVADGTPVVLEPDAGGMGFRMTATLGAISAFAGADARLARGESRVQETQPGSPKKSAAENGPEELFPSDPLFNQQEHLSNTTPGLFDLRVVDVWDDYTGAGVRITVVDDGFDYAHVDLNDSYNQSIDYDYQDGDFDPIAGTTIFSSGPVPDNHGTSVMGIIGAEQGNGVGVVGIAYDAELVGYRGFGLGFSYGRDVFLDAAGLGDGLGNTAGNDTLTASDIISMSGGLGAQVFETGFNYTNAVAAMGTISANGRGGLGTIFVKSSGNSRAAEGSALREEGTAEAYDSTKFSISVAATQMDGWVTDYSTPGANVLTSAFADDTAGNATILTTDRTGADGYNATDYNHTFSGTSAAAPMVAGVVGLMLEANPDLGWRDVQAILAYSSRHVGSAVDAAAAGNEQATQTNGSTWFWNGANNWNGGGLHFSNDYGYGLVDAKAAVRLAETWEIQSTSANQANAYYDGSFAQQTNDANGFTLTATMSSSIDVEHVEVDVDFQTDTLADLELFLKSPAGTRVQLIADTGDVGDYNGRWVFGSTAFMGETLSGDWVVEVYDDAVGTVLTTRDIDLNFYGANDTANDFFVFTNEYSDYVDFTGGDHPNGVNGGAGTDIVNAAAVDSGSIINLATNSATIDGIVTGVSNIEHVYTGDAGDTITGSALSTLISSGRGNDEINGGSGDEVLYGGAGVDIIFDKGGSSDTLYGGAGNDFLYVDSDDKANTVYGGDGFDILGLQFVTAGWTVLGNSQVSSGSTIVQLSGIEGLFGSNFADTISAFHLYSFIDANAGNDVFDTGYVTSDLDGGNGVDTIDFSTYAFSNTLNLGTGAYTDGFTNYAVINFENAVGSIAPDSFTGTSVANSLSGDAGNDVLLGDGGNDELDGGANDDNLQGGAGDDILYGGTGEDRLFGGNDHDLIYGGAQDDVILDGTGSDTVFSGDGNDFIGVSDSFGVDNADLVYAGDGNDTIDPGISSGPGEDGYYGGLGIDTIKSNGRNYTSTFHFDLGLGWLQTGGANREAFVGFENFDNAVSGLGAEQVTGTSQTNIIQTGGGANSINGRGGNDTIEAGGGNDTIDGGFDGDVLYGGEGDDLFIQGDDGATNWIYGGTGKNAIDFSGSPTAVIAGDLVTIGTSTVILDGSVRTVIGSEQADTITEGPWDLIYGGGGNDTVIGTLSAPVDNFFGGAGRDLLDMALDTLDSTLDLGAGTFVTSFGTVSAGEFEDVFAGTGQNTITGTAGSNHIRAGAGNDTIDGDGGDDTIEGGAGADSLDGGTGNDTISYEGSAAGVNVSLDPTTASGGDAAGDVIANFEHITGSEFDDFFLIGNSAGNILRGLGGSDYLIGRGGVDAHYGGAGGDFLEIQGPAEDGVGETYDGGADSDALLVRNSGAGSDYDLRDDTVTSVETLSIINGPSLNTRVKVLAQHLSGNFTSIATDAHVGGTTLIEIDMGALTSLFLSGQALFGFDQPGDGFVVNGDADNEVITGSAVSDTINGGTGNDFIVGRIGTDSHYGGAGNDILEIQGAAEDAAGEVYDGGANSDALILRNVGTGSTYDLRDDTVASIETLSIVNGGTPDTTVKIIAAQLSGSFGVLATDAHAGGATRIEIDMGVVTSLSLPGIALFGFDQPDDGYTVTGDADGETVTGSALRDTVEAGAGNDMVEGGAKGDSLNGGDDQDTLSYAGSMAGVVVDLGSGTAIGGDAAGDVFAGFEHLVGSAIADQLFGDAGTNSINGGEGNDILRGAAGNDTIVGGGGFDFADYRDAGTALTIDLATPGNSSAFFAGDTLIDIRGLFGVGGFSNTFNGDEARTFFTGGNQADVLQGNGGGDILRGRSGNDVIDGGAGRDALLGNAGNDTLTGGAERDIFWFGIGSDGDDVITDFTLGDDLIGFQGDVVNDIVDITFNTSTNGWALLEWNGGADSIEVQNLTAVQMDVATNFFFI